MYDSLSSEADFMDTSNSLNIKIFPRSTSTPTKDFLTNNNSLSQRPRSYNNGVLLEPRKYKPVSRRNLVSQHQQLGLRYDSRRFPLDNYTRDTRLHSKVRGHSGTVYNSKPTRNYFSTPYERPLPREVKMTSIPYQRSYSTLASVPVKQPINHSTFNRTHSHGHSRTSSAPVNTYPTQLHSDSTCSSTRGRAKLLRNPSSFSREFGQLKIDKAPVPTFPTSLSGRLGLSSRFSELPNTDVAAFNFSSLKQDNSSTYSPKKDSPLSNMLFVENPEELYLEPEYFDDIFKSLLISEKKYRIDSHFMTRQTSLTWGQRAYLADKLTKAQHQLSLPHPVIFAAVNIFDRVCCSKSNISRQSLVVYAATCFMIAGKAFASGKNPSASLICQTLGIPTSSSELVQLEQDILVDLDFQVLSPTPVDFLGLILMDDRYHVPTAQLCRYLANTSLYDPRLNFYPPSLIAASSLCFARLILGRGDWTSQHEELVGYTFHDLLPCLQSLTLHLSDESLRNATDAIYSTPSMHSVAVLARKPESIASAFIRFSN